MELSDMLFGCTRVPWNSMEYSMEFHEIFVSFEMVPSLFHGIPWNSVMFLFGDSRVPWNSMEYPLEVHPG